MTPDERRKAVRLNQDYFSGKISELARNIGFGLVAVSYALLTSDGVFAKTMIAGAKDELTLAAFAGCLIVLSDYAQLLFGWWSAGRAAGNEAGDYNQTRFGKALAALQFISFYIKQALAVWGAWILTSSTWKVAGSPLPTWPWS